MTEFITRNYGNENFEIIIKTDSKEHYKATENFARGLIDHTKPAPTIEAKPVVHAHWEPKKIMARTPFARNYYCSNCKDEPLECKHICGNCGAQMDSSEVKDE